MAKKNSNHKKKKVTEVTPNIEIENSSDSIFLSEESIDNNNIDENRSKEIDAELTNIYAIEDQNYFDSDMSKLQKVKRNTGKKILIGLLVFLFGISIITWIGFSYFGGKDRDFTGEQITLTIDGPSEVNNGERVTYEIRYGNASDTPIGTASIDIRLPDTFVLTGSEPSLSEKGQYKIGSMSPRSKDQISITGYYIAPLNRENDLQAIISYRPANFNSEFQKVSTKTVQTQGTTLRLKIEGPEKSLPGDKINININYRNDSGATFKNIIVLADFPDEFIPETSDPASTNINNNEWFFEELNEFATGTIKISGTFASEAQGNINIPIKIGYRNESGLFIEQTSDSFMSEALQGQLVAAMVLNGKTDKQAIKLGETLRFSISYRNTGEVSLGNVEISAVIDSMSNNELLLWNEVEDINEGLLTDNKITWSAKQITSLGRLDAGEEGIIEFTIPINQTITKQNDDAPLIKCWVETMVESVDGDIINKETKSQPVEAIILSDTELTIEARYYDDEGIPVGSGHLPPKANEETTYRVKWNLTNTLHELTDLKIIAPLPDNVSWNGESELSAGDLRFDSAERNLIWSLNWLPEDVNNIEISFGATITPTESQQGRIPTLIDATTFSAMDNIANEQIILNTPPITTSLLNDNRAQGQGRVE